MADVRILRPAISSADDDAMLLPVFSPSSLSDSSQSTSCWHNIVVVRSFRRCLQL